MANNKKNNNNSNNKKNEKKDNVKIESKKTVNTNIKKESKKIEKVSNGIDDSFSHILGVAAFIVVIFTLFYFLSAYISRESRDTEEEETSISYSDIILGRSFDMSDEKYYVLYYDQSNEDLVNDYSSIIGGYSSIETPLYVVDMSSAFNKKFSSDSSNRDAESAEDLKINGSTLILFNNKKIENYYEGDEEIKEVLSK